MGKEPTPWAGQRGLMLLGEGRVVRRLHGGRDPGHGVDTCQAPAPLGPLKSLTRTLRWAEGAGGGSEV